MADSVANAFGLPFEEQLQFFRAKLNLPTERWDDIWKSAHDRAFMVAGAMKADLLNDLRQAVDKSISAGTGLDVFRKDFAAIVQKHGWTGWTGEGSKGGVAWRTRVIWETNLRTSYAAGRWRQLTDPDTVAATPYWRYVHNDSVMHPRPHHKAWGDMRLTLRHDDPFWRTHFPPNGWGCRCRVTAVHAPTDEAATEPPAGWDAKDPKTGAQVGIDRGWNYAPGANSGTELRQLVQDKLIGYPPAITKALSRDVTRYINAHDPVPAFVRQSLAERSMTEPLWLGFVEDYEQIGQIAGQDLKGFMVLLPTESVRHVYASHGTDGHGQRPPMPEDFAQVAEALTSYDSIEKGKTSNRGIDTLVVRKTIGQERFRFVFEVLPGKKNRALALLSLVIKTR